MTKLQDKIYILCLPSSSSNVICVFEDRNPFSLRQIFKLAETISPVDIASSEKDNCLYVSDDGENCVWKITRETGDQRKIIKWLTTDYQPRTMSMTSDGKLLMVNSSLSILMIYGSDAKLTQAIQLPREIEDPIHAVETSIGNFIIIHHKWKCKAADNGECGSNGRKKEIEWGISEVTKDGDMVIRRFSSSNETHELNEPRYLSLDSDDQVFVSDEGNHRVILLDSDLKWNRILCPIREGDESSIQWPWCLCYDKEKKQLIVGGYLEEKVNVYTLTRK